MRPFDVLVASHGPLAAALLETAETICGASAHASAIGLEPSESPEGFGKRFAAQLKAGRPTLVLTDLYGGTPHNVASAAERRSGGMIRSVAGVNLGLVIEAITCTDPLDDALVERLVAAAREAIVDVAERLTAPR